MLIVLEASGVKRVDAGHFKDGLNRFKFNSSLCTGASITLTAAQLYRRIADAEGWTVPERRLTLEERIERLEKMLPSSAA